MAFEEGKRTSIANLMRKTRLIVYALCSERKKFSFVRYFVSQQIEKFVICSVTVCANGLCKVDL